LQSKELTLFYQSYFGPEKKKKEEEEAKTWKF